jgi:hypothetical protein
VAGNPRRAQDLATSRRRRVAAHPHAGKQLKGHHGKGLQQLQKVSILTATRLYLKTGVARRSISSELGPPLVSSLRSPETFSRILPV